LNANPRNVKLHTELESLRKPAVALYASLATLLIAYYAHMIWVQGFAWPVQILAYLALILLWAVPVSPLFGLAGYLLLAHGLPRYGALHDLLLANRAFEWICALLGLGMWLWLRRTQERPDFFRPATAFLLLFMAWIVVALLSVWTGDSYWAPPLRHHPLLFFQGLILYLLASQYLHEPRRTFLLALVISLIPALRWFLQSFQELHLEGDTAQLSAIALAVSLIGAFHAPERFMRALFALAGINALAMLVVTQNRAAAVTALFALVILWLTGRHKLPLFILALLAMVALAQLTGIHDYWNRFHVIWSPEASHATASLDRATVQERLALWKAGIEIIKDHPWMGVGPGNFSNIVGFYNPSIANLTVHNSYLAISAEAGGLGLLLFVALLASVLIALIKGLRHTQEARFHPSRMTLAIIVGFLAGAMFISRHDSPLLFLLLGWAIAITRPTRSARVGKRSMRANRSAQIS